MAVDRLGHLLALHVTPADVGDREAAARMAGPQPDRSAQVLLRIIEAAPDIVQQVVKTA
jgi:hypothetical protein